MYSGVYLNQIGAEFIFSSKAVHILVDMIKDYISDQGKDPKKIHLCIYFWDPDYDDVNYDDDNYEDYHIHFKDKLNYRSGKYQDYTIRHKAQNFGVRSFSTSSVSKVDSERFISRLLNTLQGHNAFTNSEDSERIIEKIIFKDFEDVFSGNTAKFIAGNIKKDVLKPRLNQYIFKKNEMIYQYINNLVAQQQSLLNDYKNSDD